MVSTPSEDPDMKQFGFDCEYVTVINWLIGKRGAGGVHLIRGPRHEAVLVLVVRTVLSLTGSVC